MLISDWSSDVCSSDLASTRCLQSLDGFYGGGGTYYWGPRSAFGGGFGASTSTPITEYVAQANVVMFKGKQPDTDVHDFDARDVRTNLEPAILRPVPKSQFEAGAAAFGDGFGRRTSWLPVRQSFGPRWRGSDTLPPTLTKSHP